MASVRLKQKYAAGLTVTAPVARALLAISLCTLTPLVVSCSISTTPASDSHTNTTESNEVAVESTDTAGSVTSTPEASAAPEGTIAETSGAPVLTAIAPTPTPTPTPYTRPPAPNGRGAPSVGDNPLSLAAQLSEAERGLRDLNASATELADYGHLQQVVYRKLGRCDAWVPEVLAALPVEYRSVAEKHVAARVALRGLSSGYDEAEFIPAWQIIEPEPAANLLGYYAEAEALTGIDREYLAAINLIETGLGRIDGLSSAGAQGPMQFLPTTWDEVGEGDVHNPRDAIIAAARYLVRRGGPDDMDGALWGYNNSDQYVATVSTYADLLRSDPSAFTGMYNWEIYFWTALGDVWLPVGLRNDEPTPLDAFMPTAPWSAPDPNLASCGTE